MHTTLADLLRPKAETPTGLPIINLDQELHLITEQIRACLPPQSLFLIAGQYQSIEWDHTELDPYEPKIIYHHITPSAFVTFISQYMVFVRGEGTKFVSLPKATADIVLSAPLFKKMTPKVSEVLPIRTPIQPRDAKGAEKKLAYQLAPVGYEPHTKIYCFDSMPPPKKQNTIEKEKIRDMFCYLLRDFPFDGENVPVEKSRSAAAAVATMLGQYLRHLIPAYPMCAINANQPGSGKTFLLYTLLSFIHAPLAVTSMPEKPDELRKIINAICIEGANTLLLDNVRNLSSTGLEALLTTPRLKGRLMATDKTFNVKNHLLTAVTGNNIKCTPDMARRCLWIDLFVPDNALKREYTTNMTRDSHVSAEWRANCLYLCDAAYRSWLDAGQPRALKGPLMDSFEKFADLTGNIVTHLGFVNPFTARSAWVDSGDVRGSTMIELVTWLAGCIQPTQHRPEHTGITVNFTIDELAIVAKKQHVIDVIAPKGSNHDIMWGNACKSIRGRIFVDEHGRRFEFGKLKGRKQTLYPITILSEPTRGDTLTPGARRGEPIHDSSATPDREIDELILINTAGDRIPAYCTAAEYDPFA